MSKASAAKRERHISPGKSIICVYADQRVHDRMKARARSLGMNVSQYVMQLARKDLSYGREMVIEPLGPA